MTDEKPPRNEFSVKLTVGDQGDATLKMYDRITVDDVFVHLVERHLFQLITRQDPGDDINPLFKDFLIKERFTAGQN